MTFLTGKFSQRVLPVSLLSGVILFSSSIAAQSLRTTQVSEATYMISGAGSNVTVSVGSDGIMLIDTGYSVNSNALLAAIREISDKPIIYIINTGTAEDQVGGNAFIGMSGQTFTGGNAVAVADVGIGATIYAHENALHKMTSDTSLSPSAWPTDVFFVEAYDLYFNNQPVVLQHQPGAIDNTNIIVHFRRADVISTGKLFRLDSYPWFDIENGGSINGILRALNNVIELAVSDKLAEGGTLIIPGHGRISDEGDLVRYRDMVTIIRDRIETMIERGHTLEEIKSSKLTLDYDSRYAPENSPWTSDMFVEAVYHSLTRR